MRASPRILHLDLDAFFASVEQRDKPSLRGKPVVVGGLGPRAVVSTASYEARRFGVHSAMSSAQARRMASHAAFLAGRFAAYRQSSRIVMALLRELSPLVEPMSLDEAFVDLAAGGVDTDDPIQLERLVQQLRSELAERTEGLSASVGVGSSKFIAKVACQAAKPAGVRIVAPGTEMDLITDLPARAVPGIGPATMERLAKLGIATVADLQQASERELVRELGQAAGMGLHALAFARDDRPVQAGREAKSISVEDTFQTDLTHRDQLASVISADADIVASRLVKAGLFAKTITVKVRLGDFTTYTRSRTLDGATDQPGRIATIGKALLAGLELHEGVRLLGLGVANFTAAGQEELFFDDEQTVMTEHVEHAVGGLRQRFAGGWAPGQDVVHDQLGRGWVWGSGQRVVTVRFEDRNSGPGPVRSLAVDAPQLHAAEPLPMAWEPTEKEDG